MKKLEDYVVSIPDFPEPGIIFRDVTSILQDADGLHLAIEQLIDMVKDLEFDEVFEYSIVGSTEADPFEGKISNESLVGKGLLGKRVGDIVEINAEVGPIRYEVLEIYK